MTGKIIKGSKKAGMKPGSVVYIGKERDEQVNIDIIDFNDADFQEKRTHHIQDCFPFKDSPTLTWINVDGIHDAGIVEGIGSHFGMHPLILEDIVNSGQRPKTEDAGEYIFVTLKMLYTGKGNQDLKAEHVSILFGSGWVITFQETGESVEVLGEPPRRRDKLFHDRENIWPTVFFTIVKYFVRRGPGRVRGWKQALHQNERQHSLK